MIAPPWPREFGEVKPLEAVKWYLQHQELLQQQTRLVREADELRRSPAAAAGRIRGAIVDDLERLHVEGAGREAALRSKIERLASMFAGGLEFTPIAQNLQREVVELYREPNVAEFVAEFDKVADVKDTTGPKLAKLQDAIARADADIAAHVLTSLDCFTDRRPPVPFRDRQLPPEATEDRLAYFAVAVIGDFVESWRRRSGLFVQPVSVHGVLLDSLPSDKCASHSEAWRLLGLSTAKPGRARLLPIDAATGQPCGFNDPRTTGRTPRPL
ncbi:MAG: hypothetical protein KDA75_16285 [Planctomycetaceae bacterium]|nr:hypothetical protein [Planctomycetaceae bacterium]